MNRWGPTAGWPRLFSSRGHGVALFANLGIIFGGVLSACLGSMFRVRWGVTLGLQLLQGLVAAVVVLHDGKALGGRGDLAAAQHQGTQEDVIPSQLPVLLDKASVKPGEEKDGDDERHGTSYTKDCPDNPRIVEVNSAGASLPHNQHYWGRQLADKITVKQKKIRGELTGQKSGSNAEVNWNGKESSDNGVLVYHNTVLGEQENDGTKTTRANWSNDPGQEYLDNAGVDISTPPVDTIRAYRRNTHSEHTTQDGVGSGHRHTQSGGGSQIKGRGADSTNHAQHEHSGLALEQVNIDDLCPDGISNTSTNTHARMHLRLADVVELALCTKHRHTFQQIP